MFGREKITDEDALDFLKKNRLHSFKRDADGQEQSLAYISACCKTLFEVSTKARQELVQSGEIAPHTHDKIQQCFDKVAGSLYLVSHTVDDRTVLGFLCQYIKENYCMQIQKEIDEL